jgi:hypothetical protein
MRYDIVVETHDRGRDSGRTAGGYRTGHCCNPSSYISWSPRLCSSVVRTQSHSGITYFLISGSAISSANWLNSTRLLIFILYTPGTKSHICISRHVKACISSTGRGAASEDSRHCRRKHRHWAGACRCGANVKGGRLNSTQVADSTTDTEQIVVSRSGSWRDRVVAVEA